MQMLWFSAGGFLHEGFVDAGAVALDVIFVFIEALGFEFLVRRHDASRRGGVAVDDNMRRNGMLLSCSVLYTTASVEQIPLLGEVVHHERFVHSRVRLRLVQGESVAEP